MTKVEFVDAIAEKTGLTKKSAGEALSAVLEVIQEAMVKGDKISLVGFGTFEVRETAARTGHNPKTGEVIEIPAGKKVAFKVGKAFKSLVND